jgi:hypothetical protein
MSADEITISLKGAPFGFPPDDALRLLPEWLRIAADKTDRRDETTGLVRRPAGHGELLRWLADRVEGKPLPRIPEPGRFAVVEAKCDAFERRVQWIHGDPTEFGNDWHSFGGSDDPYHRVWSNLIDPVLIREGVES